MRSLLQCPQDDREFFRLGAESPHASIKLQMHRHWGSTSVSRGAIEGLDLIGVPYDWGEIVAEDVALSPAPKAAHQKNTCPNSCFAQDHALIGRCNTEPLRTF